MHIVTVGRSQWVAQTQSLKSDDILAPCTMVPMMHFTYLQRLLSYDIQLHPDYHVNASDMFACMYRSNRHR